VPAAAVAKEAEEEGAAERIKNEKLRNPMHFERSWEWHHWNDELIEEIKEYLMNDLIINIIFFILFIYIKSFFDQF
jgi:hypothetical protein